MPNITINNPAIAPGQIVREDPEEVFDANLAKEMAKRTDKLGDTSIELAVRVKQAREFIAWSAHHMRGSWLEWMEESDKALKDMVQTRLAFQRESGLVVSTAKDVKEFFNTPEYVQAHAKLAELVAVLTQFERLKANGTLDAFADFILKVSCK
jgi:hypothetical protein